MPLPLPPYTPEEIRSDIIRIEREEGIKLAGLTGYSEYKGLPRARLTNLFSKSRHPHLRTYWDLTRYAGISMDDFIELVNNGQFADWIDQIVWSKQLPNVTELERRANLGQNVISHRLRGYQSWENLLGYAETAKKLGWSLEKLATRVLTKNVYTNVS